MNLNSNTIISSLKTDIIFWGLRIFTLLIISYVIIVFAWVGDDAQITLRQVWNFVNSHGITFNIPDRVQAFTHPLWFLVLSSVIFITQELYYSTVILSIVIAISSILLLFKLELNQERSNITIVSPILLLLFSWSFFDYTTSGLENPLSYLLVGLLLHLLSIENWQRNLQLSYILMALLVLNRFDHLVLLLPLALILLFECKSIKNAVVMLLPGSIILLCWFSFTTIYFGFPFPNTYYAKLSPDVSVYNYVSNGLEYLLSLKLDISSTIIICIGIILSLISKNKVLISLAIGQLLYLLYIVWVGGDFMIGRFFSILIYLSIGMIILSLKNSKFFSKGAKNCYVVFIFLLCLINGSFQQYPFKEGTNVNYKPRIGYNFISDERGSNYRSSGLWSKDRTRWEYDKFSPENLPTTYSTACGWLGGLSMTDTTSYIIDLCTLSDPFLARFPPIQKSNFTPGHLIRMMPTNYGERLIGNVNSIPDNKLNNMLNDFLLISRGDLFSWKRINSIWRLNSGYYDHIELSDYKSSDPWKPRTTHTMKILVNNWSEKMKPDKLPLRFHPDIKKFNGNLVIESKSSSIASGIWLFIDYSFIYDIYVNEKLTFTEISQDEFHCNGLILMFPETLNVKSIKLITTTMKDINFSASNRIRFLRLLPTEEDIQNAFSQECHSRFHVTKY